MKQNLMPRRLLIFVAGIFFAAYSAYNIYVFFRDGSALSSQAKFISLLVALLFGLLTVFSWTSGVKNIRFIMMRTPAFIIAMIVIFLLKLRMAESVIAYFDFSKLYSVLYGCTYLMTMAALLIVLIYYTFILKDLPLYPRASFFLPLSALLLFLCSLGLETFLFFTYGMNFEASPLRTEVIRPVFYLGFISLCGYFLVPTQVKSSNDYYYIDDKDYCI